MAGNKLIKPDLGQPSPLEIDVLQEPEKVETEREKLAAEFKRVLNNLPPYKGKGAWGDSSVGCRFGRLRRRI